MTRITGIKVLRGISPKYKPNFGVKRIDSIGEHHRDLEVTALSFVMNGCAISAHKTCRTSAITLGVMPLPFNQPIPLQLHRHFLHHPTPNHIERVVNFPPNFNHHGIPAL
ncbi:hypothetical protein SAMN05216308_101104 [Nitrosospira sp. Nsp13]|nr:hypothetical protein SAMN05216308_101104 [Nitrosospira sp. Nsp13]